MNLSYIAHAGTTTADCRALVADHTVSPFACQPAFRRPEVYQHAFPHPERFGVAATDRLFKSTGQPNFNASLYLDVASRFQHDSIELFRNGRCRSGRPPSWRRTPCGPSQATTRSSSARCASRSPATRTGSTGWCCCVPIATGFNDPARFSANAGAFPWGEALGSISYTLLGLFVLALYGGIAGWRRGSRAEAGLGDQVLRTVCAVALGLLVFSVVIGNALDFRENNRFRVEAGPFTLVLAAVGAELLLRRLNARRSARAAASSAVSGPTGSR